LGLSKYDIPKSWLYSMDIVLTDPRKRQRVIDYCKHDAFLAQELFEHARKSFESFGMPFNKPLSAGSLAMNKFGSRMKNSLPLWEHNKFQRLFHGGRFEVFKKGYFTDCYMYDINSAYPHALSTFFDPRLCHIKKGKTYSDKAVYGYYDVVLHIPSNIYISPVGRITKLADTGSTDNLFPVGSFRSILDLYSLRSALPYVEKILYSHEFFPSRLTKLLFPEMTTLYLERKLKPELSLAIKLVINSLYGKHAERIRKLVSFEKLYKGPPLTITPNDLFFKGEFYRRVRAITSHTDFLIASHVTGFTRHELFNKMILEEKALIFCATDGIVTNSPLPISLSDKLGAWNLKAKLKELIIIGSGIYAYRPSLSSNGVCPICNTVLQAENHWHNTFRGFNTSNQLRDILKKSEEEEISVPVVINYSLDECVRRNRLDLLNQIKVVNRYLNVNFDRKRLWDCNLSKGKYLLEKQIDSQPWIIG